MEEVKMEIDTDQDLSPEPLIFARSYQLEALEKATKQNTIVYLETGSGKTLIAVMLLRSYAYQLRKPSPFIAVFLVPTVVLVTQQAGVIEMHTDLKVGKYWGELGVDYWNAVTWKQELCQNEVLVMTPQILYDALSHSFLKLDIIKVLIFDECHNARGNHPYACIMTDFYHRQMNNKKSELPRIFGMTASPIKAKGSSTSSGYWKQISELENLLNSKVYTCASQSVLAEYIPFSTLKLKIYDHGHFSLNSFVHLSNDLTRLEEKHEYSIIQSDVTESVADSAKTRLSKLSSNLRFCLTELGVWPAMKAAELFSCQRADIFSWRELDICGERVIRDFNLDVLKVFSACIPSDLGWSIGENMKADVEAGYLTTRVNCLVESLLEYRHLRDLRCIIFVERVVTAIVLCALLSELCPKVIRWRTEYTAGNQSQLQTQSRKEQNKIVDEFRNGTVNIIVATSILEEGLDVQSCNLVIRFDLSATVSSFIQSRGRARKPNSDFLLMVKSGDTSTLNRVKNYIASGDTMREESMRHASVPCAPLDSKFYSEPDYQVESTGAIVTLSSSVGLVHFYCSRLPCDGYFKPTPRCEINKQLGTCTIIFPKSCPLQNVSVEGNIKTLKQLACLEACKKLHQIGALTDHLVPDIVGEEADAEDFGREPYFDEKLTYVPPELVGKFMKDSSNSYHCYLIELQRNFDYDIPLNGVVLAVKTEIEFGGHKWAFDLDVDRGNLAVGIKYVGIMKVTSDQVLLCQKFQFTLFRLLLDHDISKLQQDINASYNNEDLEVFDYLLLPSISSHQKQSIIDWKCISSVLFTCGDFSHVNCLFSKGSGLVTTINGPVCRCMLKNCLVYTPHNGHVYCITGTLDNLHGNSLLRLRNGEVLTYKNYYKSRHGVDLRFEGELLLNGRHVFPVKNYLQSCRTHKEKEPSNTSVELPPELCYVLMSPISIATCYSFSFVPSIMYRIESLLIAGNLKKLHLDHCTQNIDLPTFKVLEAITTKKCQEKFHLESLETLGDSFLKYAASQQLFTTYQNSHEGLLSAKKDKIISNVALCKLGCDRNLPGFIRNEPFDPKSWILPGDYSGSYQLTQEVLSTTRIIYIVGMRKIKIKTVADAVEALIGAFLSAGGEMAALIFIDWLGIKMDFVNTPYDRHFAVHPEKLVNVSRLESLLNYKFHDASLLVEALTHGSYMLPEIPRCYQRLEFLGDAVLDYLITMHMYRNHPGMSPGLLTDLRSASVNNDCYARSAVQAELHKYILHASQELHRQIVQTVDNFKKLSRVSTFGWDSEMAFPKVLGDVIESLAGAIFVDSGYNKGTVFQSIRPLLEPLITPQTVRLHPVRELTELCQREHYDMKKDVVSQKCGVACITIEVEANGITHKHSSTASDKKFAKKLACRAVLKSIKECISMREG